MRVKALSSSKGPSLVNGHVESFNGKLRDDLLNREVFNWLAEDGIFMDQWHREYNRFRPHSALHYQRPPSEAILVAPPT